MVVSSLSEAGVVKLTEWVVLYTASGPVIHGIAKPLAAAAPHDDLFALAALFAHGRDPTMSAQSMIVPLCQRVRAV